MKEVKVGIVGLGRLGSVHAQNLAFKIPGCKLVAACSLEQKELDWAKDYLKVDFVTTDYKKMVDEADIEAVVIVSSSPEHCWMIEYALDAGKHVFTDKPLGCSLEECKRAEAAVERHPDKLFFLGFMRRYDPSYADAKAQIDAGKIGKPYLVKAPGLDPEAHQVLQDLGRYFHRRRFARHRPDALVPRRRGDRGLRCGHDLQAPGIHRKRRHRDRHGHAQV